MLIKINNVRFGYLIFLLIFYFTFACISSYNGTKNALEIDSINNLDLNNDGITDQVIYSFRLFQGPGINTTRIIKYTIDYKYADVVEENVINDLQIPESVINNFYLLKTNFDDSIYACKNAINYPEILYCKDYANCMIACKKSNLCEMFLANDYAQGMKKIKDISNKIQEIESNISEIDSLLESKDIQKAMNISRNLIDEYNQLYSLSLNSPCSNLNLDSSYPSNLYISLRNAITNVKKIENKKREIIGYHFYVDDNVIVKVDENNLYTKIKFNYSPVVSNIYNIKTSSPPYGDLKFENFTFYYDYESLRDNYLAFVLKSTYEFDYANKEYESLLNKPYQFTIDTSYIPNDSFRFASFYVFVFSSLDSIIDLYERFFGPYIGFALILFSVYLVFQFLFKYLNIFLIIISSLTSKNFKKSLLQIAGKHNTKFLLYLIIASIMFIGISIYLPKDRIIPNYTEFKSIALFRLLVSDYVNLLLSVVLFISMVVIKDSLIEILKMIVLGEEYYLSDEDKLRRSILKTKKEIALLKSEVENLLNEVKTFTNSSKFQEEYIIIPVQKAIAINNNEIFIANREKLNNIDSLTKTVRTRLISLKDELEYLNKSYNQNKDSWIIQMQQILEKNKKLTELDLLEIGVPEQLVESVINEFYSSIDKKTYGLQKNTIYLYPKDFVESNIFSLISSNLKNKNMLLNSVIFDMDCNIIEDNLPRESCRSVMKVMTIKLLTSIKRLVEINYAKSINYVLINLTNATAIILLGKHRNLLLIVSKNADLSEIFAFARPLIIEMNEEK
ncbi:MAG: hypothetical protein QXF76_02110 [Candidatus Anstonellales archaeon]